jgi:soluble lytic murein transglycosylase-like protein
VAAPAAEPDVSRLFHLQTNLRFGCAILRHYLKREQGNLFLALGSYNGSRGQAAYPEMVLGARKRWEAALATTPRVAALGITTSASQPVVTRSGGALAADERRSDQAAVRP